MAGGDAIFASPPEPIFNSPVDCLPKELLQEWLVSLANDNCKEMKKASISQGYFKTGDCAEFVFLTCSKLQLPNVAKYMALDLFDRFMVQHIADLRSHVKSSASQRKSSDWYDILDRVQNQMILRIVSCCQLAAKLTSHYKLISHSKARRFLRDAGHCYSNESLLQSEMRVLKTLDYKISTPTAAVYIETLLEILGHNMKGCQIKAYYGISLKLMDIFYLKREKVYEMLYSVSCPNLENRNKYRKNFICIQSDNMLLAVSVLASSVYLIDQKKTDVITDELAKITGLVTDDILNFAAILVQLVLSKEPGRKIDTSSCPKPRDITNMMPNTPTQ